MTDTLLFYIVMAVILIGLTASVVGAVIELRPAKVRPPTIDWPTYPGQPHDTTENEGHD